MNLSIVVTVPERAAAQRPGMRRAAQLVEDMERRGATPAQIARALGRVPQDLPVDDPFGTDPRCGASRRQRAATAAQQKEDW